MNMKTFRFFLGVCLFFACPLLISAQDKTALTAYTDTNNKIIYSENLIPFLHKLKQIKTEKKKNYLVISDYINHLTSI